ncbi:MAG: ribonuclease PH [Bacteroidetes bacterium]|nr:ribonuclease PH [Bacteroidota bacterium]
MPQRRPNALRPTTIEPYPTNAAGSVLITQGGTRVLCTASISEEAPPWMIDKATGVPTRGWVTAEYAMLPGSTNRRKRRGTDSRATEIQRLIGRVLRAGVDLEKMPGVTITCDCDVLAADGGTRTASITGAFVALSQAVAVARERGLIRKNPIRGPVAAVSVGIVDGKPQLDLDYELDVKADVDMNVAMNHRGQFIEVQGTGEQGVFSREELGALLDLAAGGIRKLIAMQRAALRAQ